MPSLAEKLNNLGLQKGIDLQSPKRPVHKKLSEILDGSIIKNQLGSVVVMEKVYPYGYQHGDVNFIKYADFNVIHRASKLTTEISNHRNLVFLDTETTGLSGGTGTLVFLIGVARFTEEGLNLSQFLIEDPSDEPAMLLELSNYGVDVDAVVTFNGKSFDMPLLKTRYLLNRMPIPFTGWGHLDLLHLSRRIWRQRLSSRSLKDLEQEILHIPRSDDEVPGWMIPEIYFNYLHTGDASLIANVVYHNAMDIVSLAALYFAITRMLEEDLFSEKLHALDAYAIGQLYENIGDTEKAICIYEDVLGNKRLDNQKKIEITTRLALLYKKQGQWEKAVICWISNGKAGNVDSCIELAKYFEHETRDISSASEWTMRAINCLDNAEIVRYKKNLIMKALTVRKLRLEKRISHVQKEN